MLPQPPSLSSYSPLTSDAAADPEQPVNFTRMQMEGSGEHVVEPGMDWGRERGQGVHSAAPLRLWVLAGQGRHSLLSSDEWLYQLSGWCLILYVPAGQGVHVPELTQVLRFVKSNRPPNRLVVPGSHGRQVTPSGLVSPGGQYSQAS